MSFLKYHVTVSEFPHPASPSQPHPQERVYGVIALINGVRISWIRAWFAYSSPSIQIRWLVGESAGCRTRLGWLDDCQLARPVFPPAAAVVTRATFAGAAAGVNLRVL